MAANLGKKKLSVLLTPSENDIASPTHAGSADRRRNSILSSIGNSPRANKSKHKDYTPKKNSGKYKKPKENTPKQNTLKIAPKRIRFKAKWCNQQEKIRKLLRNPRLYDTKHLCRENIANMGKQRARKRIQNVSKNFDKTDAILSPNRFRLYTPIRSNGWTHLWNQSIGQYLFCENPLRIKKAKIQIITNIQSLYRKYKAACVYRRQKKAAIFIQTAYRLMKDDRKAKNAQKNRHAKFMLEINSIQNICEAPKIISLQSLYRKYTTTCVYQRIKKAVISIQSAYRTMKEVQKNNAQEDAKLMLEFKTAELNSQAADAEVEKLEKLIDQIRQERTQYTSLAKAAQIFRESISLKIQQIKTNAKKNKNFRRQSISDQELDEIARQIMQKEQEKNGTACILHQARLSYDSEIVTFVHEVVSNTEI